MCENKDFCNIVMLSKETKILEFNQNKKSEKGPFVVYADLKWLIKKTDGCNNNPENSWKLSKDILSGFSMFTISFKNTENKHDVYRGKDFMKKFCESLWKHAMKIINFTKKKMKFLTNEQQHPKICYICTERFEDKTC